MPIIMYSNTIFDESRKNYRIDLRELAEVFPHIEEDKETDLYFVELKNERDKLIKRFKPFKRLQLKIGKYWYEIKKKWLPCLLLPEATASQFNIGNHYKIAIIITTYNGRPFLPLETKVIGSEAQKIYEYFSAIEADLLSLSLEQPILNKAVSYLWDACLRLQENDIEGARTALRNSLSILRKDFLAKITVSEESEESEKFPKKLDQLTNAIMNFVHYGGPHPGPAPRTTTEMTISLTVDLIRYLSKSINNNIISFHGT